MKTSMQETECSPDGFTVTWCLQAFPYFYRGGSIASPVCGDDIKVVGKVLTFSRAATKQLISASQGLPGPVQSILVLWFR